MESLRIQMVVFLVILTASLTVHALEKEFENDRDKIITENLKDEFPVQLKQTQKKLNYVAKSKYNIEDHSQNHMEISPLLISLTGPENMPLDLPTKTRTLDNRLESDSKHSVSSSHISHSGPYGPYIPSQDLLPQEVQYDSHDTCPSTNSPQCTPCKEDIEYECDSKYSQQYIPCRKGWYLYGDKCYKVFRDRRTWPEASKHCSEEGGHLVTVSSKEIQEFLVAYFVLDVRHTVWMGLNDLETKNGKDDKDSKKDDKDSKKDDKDSKKDDKDSKKDDKDSKKDDKDSKKDDKNSKKDDKDSKKDDKGSKKDDKDSKKDDKNSKKDDKDSKKDDKDSKNDDKDSKKDDKDSKKDDKDSKKKKERNFTWQDGTRLCYTNWGPGEPSSTSENCGEIIYGNPHVITSPRQWGYLGIWNDGLCESLRFPYICQVNKSEDRKTISPDPRFCPVNEGGGFRFRESCYHIVRRKKSWEEAEKHCQENFNGQLVTILDREREIFINYLLSNDTESFWIGIRREVRGVQKWVSGWHVVYSKLNRDLKDMPTGTCVVRKKSQVWVIADCSLEFRFICETTSDEAPILKRAPEGWQCPDVSDEWVDLEGEYCYIFGKNTSLTWFEANEDCQRKGGTLASITSKDEERTLQHHVITHREVFFGLRRSPSNRNVFEWVDECPMDYTNWEPGQPNNVNEECGELYSNTMTWNDISCNARGRTYICSAKKVPPSRTGPGCKKED